MRSQISPVSWDAPKRRPLQADSLRALEQPRWCQRLQQTEDDARRDVAAGPAMAQRALQAPPVLSCRVSKAIGWASALGPARATGSRRKEPAVGRCGHIVKPELFG